MVSIFTRRFYLFVLINKYYFEDWIFHVKGSWNMTPLILNNLTNNFNQNYEVNVRILEV